MRQPWQRTAGWARKIWLLLSYIAVALVASCAAWIGNQPRTLPLPPLLQGIQARPASDPEDFTQRLRDRFPLGSPESDLIRELWLEGFQPKTDLRAPKRTASFIRWGSLLGDICRRDADVNWAADDSGRLTTLSGSYFAICP